MIFGFKKHSVALLIIVTFLNYNLGLVKCEQNGKKNRVGPIQKTNRPPCCMDSLTQIVCRKFLHSNETNFLHRCNYNAEFRLIQCCSSCNKYKRVLPYDEIASTLITENCFDRYGENFCKRYVSAFDVWELKQWSCAGYSPYMAFRACRKTCGFCDLDRIDYTLANALEACKLIKK